MSTSAPYKRLAATLTFITFISWTVSTPLSWAQVKPVTWNTLPDPDQMLPLGEVYVPPQLNGVTVHPQDPFRFDFLITLGDETGLKGDALKSEAERLIRYFMAALAVPEKDLWVNLSPFEDGRIVPSNLGATEMGRDLLAEDYLLKQMTAALLHPDNEWGRRFWRLVYDRASEEYGTIDIPVNTFNKVWVLPDKAVVYQEGYNAYIAEAKLKVMLEQDVLQLEAQHASDRFGWGAMAGREIKRINAMTARLMRRIIVPILTKEVNESPHFAKLRQIYHGLVMATWFKKNLRDNLINQVYADRSKIRGIDLADDDQREAIYQKYLQAYQRGAYEIIKEEIDPLTQEMIPRRYFTGGAEFRRIEPATKIYKPGDAGSQQTRRRVVNKLIRGLLGTTALTAPGSSNDVIAHLREMSPEEAIRRVQELSPTKESKAVGVAALLLPSEGFRGGKKVGGPLASPEAREKILEMADAWLVQEKEARGRGWPERKEGPRSLDLKEIKNNTHLEEDDILRAVADIIEERLSLQTGSLDHPTTFGVSDIRNKARLHALSPKVVKRALENYGAEIGLHRLSGGRWAAASHPDIQKTSVGAARRGRLSAARPADRRRTEQSARSPFLKVVQSWNKRLSSNDETTRAIRTAIGKTIKFVRQKFNEPITRRKLSLPAVKPMMIPKQEKSTKGVEASTVGWNDIVDQLEKRKQALIKRTAEESAQPGQATPTTINVVRFNATRVGGGVAELIRNQQEFVKTTKLFDRFEWDVIDKAPDEFFAVTAKIHGALHNPDPDLDLTPEEIAVYQSAGVLNALRPRHDEDERPAQRALKVKIYDDPQVIPTMTVEQALRPDEELRIFRLHIATDRASPHVLERLRRWVIGDIRKDEDPVLYEALEALKGEGFVEQAKTTGLLAPDAVVFHTKKYADAFFGDRVIARKQSEFGNVWRYTIALETGKKITIPVVITQAPTNPFSWKNLRLSEGMAQAMHKALKQVLSEQPDAPRDRLDETFPDDFRSMTGIVQVSQFTSHKGPFESITAAAQAMLELKKKDPKKFETAQYFYMSNIPKDNYAKVRPYVRAMKAYIKELERRHPELTGRLHVLVLDDAVMNALAENDEVKKALAEWTNDLKKHYDIDEKTIQTIQENPRDLINPLLINTVQTIYTPVQPSIAEGSGLTLTEAMLKADVLVPTLPVATDIGGLSAQIPQGFRDNGLAVPIPNLEHVERRYRDEIDSKIIPEQDEVEVPVKQLADELEKDPFVGNLKNALVESLTMTVEAKQQLARQAREHILHNFTLTTNMMDLMNAMDAARESKRAKREARASIETAALAKEGGARRVTTGEDMTERLRRVTETVFHNRLKAAHQKESIRQSDLVEEARRLLSSEGVSPVVSDEDIVASLDEVAKAKGLTRTQQHTGEGTTVVYKYRSVGGILLDPMYLEMSLTGETGYSPADLKMFEANMNSIEGLRPQIINIIRLPVEVLPQLFSQNTSVPGEDPQPNLTLSARR